MTGTAGARHRHRRAGVGNAAARQPINVRRAETSASVRCHGAGHFRRGVPPGPRPRPGVPGPLPRHGLRRPPRCARTARLRYPEAAGAGPAHLPAGAGPGRGGAGVGPGGRRGGEAGPGPRRDPAPGGGGEAWPVRVPVPAGEGTRPRDLPPGQSGSEMRGSRWGAGPMSRLPSAPREEGPVHRGRPDEPPGPHRQRLHPEGTAGARGGGCPLPALPTHAPASPCSSTRWTSSTRWRAGRPSAPATSESHGTGAARLACSRPRGQARPEGFAEQAARGEGAGGGGQVPLAVVSSGFGSTGYKGSLTPFCDRRFCFLVRPRIKTMRYIAGECEWPRGTCLSSTVSR